MVNPYAVMYDAVMTVKRWHEIEQGGYTKHVLSVAAAGIPCRYSSSGQVSAQPPNAAIENGHKLFCGLEADIREGDRVEICLRTGKRIEGMLGECHPYTYQWQCEVKRDENA